MRRRNGNLMQLDDVDRQLIALLRRDPRISNRALAAEVAITDETVAIRLKRMLEAGVMAMTAFIDWDAAGYHAYACARVKVAGRPPSEVVKPLLDVEGIHVVSENVGSCDVLVALLATNIESLQRMVTQHLRSLEDVTDVAVDIVTETCTYELGATTLPIAPWSPAGLPDPVIPLDELDLNLLSELITSGHESNRELARRVGVSDGTVRARIKRMEDAGLLRIVASVDTVTSGETGSAAWAFINVEGDDESVVNSLKVDPHIGSLYRCVGDFDLIAVAVSATPDDLNVYLGRDLRALPGVRTVEVATAVEALRHRAHLVRFT
jgi:DNA-binding Lrp family transcriptional regulator